MEITLPAKPGPDTGQFDKISWEEEYIKKEKSPSQSNFEGMGFSNMIVDTNSNVEDCKRAYNLFGENLTDLKGKTIQVKPNQVEP